MKTIICAAAVVAAFACATQTSASAACITINTAAQLQAISNHLDRDYCLGKDIDLDAIANFDPLALNGDSFTGTFDGGGHTISNLHMNRGDQDNVGLFGRLNNATIKHLTLEGVAVAGSKNGAFVGALAGHASGASLISDVHAGGQVAFIGNSSTIGGFVATLDDSSIIETSSSALEVGAGGDTDAGGFAGDANAGTIIRNSYATGLVFCGDNCNAGGLVGSSANTITRAFATGGVVCGAGSLCGGALGFGGGTFAFLYSSGSVLTGTNTTTGGLIGQLNGGATTLDQSFSVGLVGGSGTPAGGLVGDAVASPTITNSYWDKQTSHLSTSAGGGVGRTTAQLRSTMPSGFVTTIWGITLRYSYPYLKSPQLDFKAALATSVVNTLVFAFNPLSQLDQFNYLDPAAHADQASLAACYTMIARAIGEAETVGSLQDVAIDKYFWRDATRKTFWRGPVTQHATLGTFKGIPAATPLTTNVIPAMKHGNLVLLRGSYNKGGTHIETWMLGTLFTADEDGTVLRVIANDPLTGQQVQINPSTKRVLSPSGFPLTNFTVDGYQPVTISVGP